MRPALKDMKTHITSGPDGMVLNYIKMDRWKVLNYLGKLLSDKGEIPEFWNNAKIITIYKKKG